MIKRRSFLRTGFATALFSSWRTSQASEIRTPFPAQLKDALAKALGEPGLAAKLAPILLDVGFTWEPPSQPAPPSRQSSPTASEIVPRFQVHPAQRRALSIRNSQGP